VSSTRRSDWRSRVITGTDRVVNISSWPAQRTPQETLRRNRRSASRAISIRCSRVSSRNRFARPSAAARVASPSVSADSSASASGAESVPTTVISSRSTITSAGPVNQSSGSLPANQPAISVLMIT